MKIYLHNKTHIDARQVLSYLEDTPYELTDSVAEADCMLVLSGMYLTYGDSDGMEEELELAAKQGLPVLTAAPHGTPYIPMKLRKYTKAHCSLQRKSVLDMLAAQAAEGQRAE